MNNKIMKEQQHGFQGIATLWEPNDKMQPQSLFLATKKFHHAKSKAAKKFADPWLTRSETGDISEDGDVVVDLGPVLLGDALRYPDNVPALLLLQLQEGVEDAEVELLHERVHVQVHLQG